MRVDNGELYLRRRKEIATFVAPVQGGKFTSYMSHKQHAQVNCTAIYKMRKMYRHAHIYPTGLSQSGCVGI